MRSLKKEGKNPLRGEKQCNKAEGGVYYNPSKINEREELKLLMSNRQSVQVGAT